MPPNHDAMWLYTQSIQSEVMAEATRLLEASTVNDASAKEDFSKYRSIWLLEPLAPPQPTDAESLNLANVFVQTLQPLYHQILQENKSLKGFACFSAQKDATRSVPDYNENAGVAIFDRYVTVDSAKAEYEQVYNLACAMNTYQVDMDKIMVLCAGNNESQMKIASSIVAAPLIFPTTSPRRSKPSDILFVDWSDATNKEM